MEFKTKFSVGDFASDKTKRFMGRVKRVEASQGEDVFGGPVKVEIYYVLEVKGASWKIAEDQLIGLKFEGESSNA